jgi:zinc protease
MRTPLLIFASLAIMNPLMPAATTDTKNAIQFPSTTARHWTLRNGLTLIVQEDRSAPVASVQAWCQTGSINEDKHLGAGLSHILEHMLFKGTETRSNSEIAQKIQDAGGYINAYTSYDRTVYWIDTPSKGVDTAVDILSDAMMNSTLPREEYDKEQEVIRREFAMGFDDPDRMSSIKLFETAYSEHPYRLPVIGLLDIYNKLTRDDVMAYYKKRYVPNNLFFVVVGDVNGDEIHKRMEKYFENYPAQSLVPTYIPPEPPQLGRRESHTEFKTELTRLEMAWHIPQLTHPDLPALDLLSVILGDGRSSLLYRKIREELGLAHSVSAFCYAPADPGLFGVDATLDPDKRAAAEEAVLKIIDELKQKGVSPADLEKAKKQSLSNQLQALTTMRGKASDLGSNWLSTRNLNFSRDYLQAIQRVTAEDIKRVLATYFTDRNLTVTSLNPPGSLAKEAERRPDAAAGEIQKFELPNGLRLLVREDPRLPLVSAVAVFKAGLLAENRQDNGISKVFSRVMLKGTKTRTAEQIAEQIEAVGGNIGIDAGNNSISVSVKVMQPDLKLGLGILSDVLLNPTMPEKALAREKQIQLAAIKAEEEEMTVVARNLLRANLFSDHPYGLRTNGTPESIENLTRQGLIDFHNKYVVGRNGVIAVFGDVKASEVKALIEKEFAAMPSGEPAFAAAPQPHPFEKSVSVEETKDKAQAIIMVGYRGADVFSPDRHALELIDEASSDLGSRFFIRIREKMGLAYFVGSSQVPGLVPGPFVFYLGTSPEKAEAVKTEFLDEIAKLSREGLTAEELARAKEKLLGQLEIRNQSNDAFAAATALDELYGLGYQHYKSVRPGVEAVTLDQVKEVARKYFDNKPSVFAIVRPQPKQTAAK